LAHGSARGAAPRRLEVSGFPESIDYSSVAAPVVMRAGRGPSKVRVSAEGRPRAGTSMGVVFAVRVLV